MFCLWRLHCIMQRRLRKDAYRVLVSWTNLGFWAILHLIVPSLLGLFGFALLSYSNKVVLKVRFS